MMNLKMETFISFETAKKLEDKRFDLGILLMNFIGAKIGLSRNAGNSFILHVGRQLNMFI